MGGRKKAVGASAQRESHPEAAVLFSMSAHAGSGVRLGGQEVLKEE